MYRIGDVCVCVYILYILILDCHCTDCVHKQGEKLVVWMLKSS